MKRLIKSDYDSRNLIMEYSTEDYKIINILLKYYTFDELNLTSEEIKNIKNIFPLIENSKVGVYVLVDVYNYVLTIEQLSIRFNKTMKDIQEKMYTYNAKDFDMEDSFYFIDKKDAESALKYFN